MHWLDTLKIFIYLCWILPKTSLFTLIDGSVCEQRLPLSHHGWDIKSMDRYHRQSWFSPAELTWEIFGFSKCLLSVIPVGGESRPQAARSCCWQSQAWTESCSIRSYFQRRQNKTKEGLCLYLRLARWCTIHLKMFSAKRMPGKMEKWEKVYLLSDFCYLHRSAGCARKHTVKISHPLTLPRSPTFSSSAASAEG